MCTYNGEKYLQEQLDSIISQTYPIYELIIQDDNSVDKTIEIIQKYQQKYSYIKYFSNDKQKGINDNFITAIQRANGDYIALSDQDDIWEINKIEHQISSIGNALLSSGITKPFSNDKISIHFDKRTPNIHLERIIYLSMMAGHTLMFKKELINKIPNINYWSQFFLYDHLIQIVAATYESISYCPEILVKQRRHADSSTLTIPFNYEYSLPNIIRSIFRTYKTYKDIRPFVKKYFFNMYSLLLEIQSPTISRTNAMKLSLYNSRSSFISYIRLTLLCIQHRDRIFHSNEKNRLSFLKAIYFPISSSDYLQYLSK